MGIWKAINDPDGVPPKWLRGLKRHLSIRACIFLVYLIVVGGGFYLLMDTLMEEIKPRYLESMEESLVDTANILASLVENEFREGENKGESIASIFEGAYERVIPARIYSLEKDSVDLRVYLTDENGRIVYHSLGDEYRGRDFSVWRDVSLTLGGHYGARSTWDRDGDEPVLVLYVAAPVVIDGSVQGVLTVGKPTTYINELVAEAQERYRVYGILSGVAVLVMGLLLSLWLTRPIHRMIRYAHDVRDGKKVVLPKLFGMEANAMGRAFEEMRDALEGKQYVEQYAQSLAHQIKAPLSGVIGAAELLEGEMSDEERRRFLGNVRKESDRIRRIVDRMLELAALETRKGIENPETIDLGDLLKEVIGDVKMRARHCELDWCLEIDGESAVKGVAFEIVGERFLVRQAFTNVLRNAVEFSPEGGRLRARLCREGKRIVCTVEDEGEGIPEYALERVYERFYSLPRPLSGEKSSGVGLSFVKEIMALHGGSVRVENRKSRGARVILTW